ncbi:MAG: sulfurtransferase complex subunit TusD [Succinivibrionaceae bacterium]
MSVIMDNQVFTLLVHDAPYGRETSSLAYLFAQEVVKNHCLRAVFFYEDGVLNAIRGMNPASDEFNLVKSWIALAKEHQVRLVICESAGERRGINNITAEGSFEIGSLSDAASFSLRSDKLVQFR